MKTYQWKYTHSVGSNYYHDEEGKIHGEITRVNITDEIYSASLLYPDNDLGKYITRETAMKAVENQIDDPLYNIRKLWPQQEEETPTYGLYEPGLKFDLTPPEDDLSMYAQQTYSHTANCWPMDLDSEPSFTLSTTPSEEKPKKKKKK